ncbi:hypothetical protein N7509_008705 [Penicillium cosmopolitanum]|uniref:Uncharacterized protein n=1 Tax=Penicillium cosmopolitanum TaxID=1131564 RepID=A0A9X0B2X1_9EURO|nr:uncharacterized protein N7509_008705 [Penicillium cosmopolitanum]KAJ5386164.1 hypothetical protein N7509_008705 [Penicillium cosmopolitanum]
MSPRSPQSLDSPNGAALTWIFDHCLRYPASYEIPLRDMYTFNYLETRWKKEMEAALTRLGIKREDAENPNSSGFAGKYPGVMTWLHSMNTKARTVTALYTQIYVGLRRWVLINDMLLEPQNKHLKTQRDGFFRYINAVAINGKEALDPVIVQGAPEGEATSWGPLHDCLVRYVDHVNELINECLVVTEPSYLSEGGSPHRNKNRKADSGISFGSSGIDASLAEGEAEKPLPYFPIPKANPAKTGSFLERIAREVRSLGPNARTKNLKKMKSTTALDSRPGSQQSSAESSFFEIDEQKRRRLLGEATSRKISQS